MSLIGDTLTVVTNARQIGNLIDANGHNSFNVPAALVDQPVLIAVDDTLQQVNPDYPPFCSAPRRPCCASSKACWSATAI